MAHAARGSEALIREWASKSKPVPEQMVESAAELLDEWRITNILTHGLPPMIDHVLIEFEGGAGEDDYERCGNIVRGLGHVTPHGPGVPIQLRFLINGIPAIDLVKGELEIGAGAGV